MQITEITCDEILCNAYILTLMNIILVIKLMLSDMLQYLFL